MPETSDHATAVATEPTLLDQSHGSHLDSLYRAAIGPMQADYYLPILKRFESYGRASPSWNWAAFGMTLNWMLLRGLWLPAVLYLAALAASVLALAAGMAMAAPPLAESVQWSLWAALLTMVLLIPGFFGNGWLYGVYRKRVDKALAGTGNLQDACAMLARQAASRPRLLVIALANIALAVLLAVWLWPSEMHMRMWPRVSGDISSIAIPASGSASASVPADAATAAASAPEAAPQAAAPQEAVSAPAGATSAADDNAENAESADTAVTPATQPTTDPAPASTANFDLGASGPATRAALQQQAAIAAHARAARGPVAAAASAPPVTTAPLATQKPATSKAIPPVPAGRYLINVGLFAEQDNALRVHARLKAAGLPAISESLQMRNGQRTRVRAGPFATRAQADAAAERIRALKLDAIVIRQ